MELRDEYEKQQKYRKWMEILELLPIENNQIIADLGCGTGGFTEIVSEKVKHVIAVDRNKNLLNNLKEKNIKKEKVFRSSMVRRCRSSNRIWKSNWQSTRMKVMKVIVMNL